MSQNCWLLLSLFGTAPFGAPTAAEPVAVEVAPLPAPPAEARDRTYFLVVNGLDPLLLGGLDCFSEAIRDAGYTGAFPLGKGEWKLSAKAVRIGFKESAERAFVLTVS